jgi:mono/diheme cytochrome c family protein
MKLLTSLLAATLLPILAISALAELGSAKQTFDRAAYYKKSCAECHGSEADKKFNSDLPEHQMVDAILNGQTMETPPDMPAFADKGINEERAKALLAYMKALRQ